MENATDREITVHLGYNQWRMRPCSVQVTSLVAGPPLSSGGAEFEVEDATGKSLQAIEVQAEQKRPGDKPQLYLRVADQGPVPCPSIVVDRYMLEVKSFLDTDVQLFREGELVGTIAPFGQGEFGPLQGTLGDSDKIVVRKPDGTECRPGWATVVYRLGDVPEVPMQVTKDSFR